MNKMISVQTIGLATWLLMTRAVFGQGCYESSILSPTPFMGNNGEIFRLDDGSIWEVRYEYEYLYEYYPKVTICPSKGLLILRGKALSVQQVAASRPPSGSRPPTSPTETDRSLQLDTRTDDEFSFYDSQGRASVFLEPSGGLTFYLWSGEPVAYLVDESVFGFNGKHLGWYHNGLIYDHDGGIVAAPASAFREPVDPPPPRSLKSLKPLKSLKELKPLKPMFSRTWSNIPARAFFLLGID